MSVTKFPGRRDVATTAPAVSIIGNVVRFDFGSSYVEMTLSAASGFAAKVQDKLAALAKVQTS